MNKFILAAAAVALSAGIAQAQTSTESIIKDLESQGYKDIEISQEDGRIQVEAMRGNQEVELVYDAETGDLVSRDDERTTGLERAEQVSGKDLPANGAADRDADDDNGDEDDGRGNSEGKGNSGGNSEGNGGGNGGGDGNGGGNGEGRN